MDKVEEFLNKCREAGYSLSGSVFKVDYNGSVYNVGFWISPKKYNHNLDKYELPGIKLKVKNENFENALNDLIHKATIELEGNS